MKKTLLIFLLMATARAQESPVAAPTVAPVSRLTEAEQKQIWQEANAAYFSEKNYDRALELFHRLAAAGHGGAMGRIGHMYEKGDGVAEDYATAKQWYEKLGDAGDRTGYWHIGWLYMLGGPGLEQDYASAKQWFEKAGDALNNISYGQIGDLYRQGGPGLEQDYTSAKWWYEKAIAAGDSNGYKQIGFLYKEGGPGIKRNWATAKQWFEKAGDAGNSFGYGWIGRLYEAGGPGLERDLEQACRYYQKAGSDWQEAVERTCYR